MTLAVAWTRRIGSCEELFVASDSRLTGGYAWDACPKIFLFGRSDVAVAFAGHTLWAYPLMLQMANAISSHRPAATRAMDIGQLKGHAVKVFNALYHEMRNKADEPDIKNPDVSFLIVGYSWVYKRFKIWRVAWNAQRKEFTSKLMQRQPNGCLLKFIGDQTKYAKAELHKRMNTLGGRLQSYNMEPFAVLCSIIRDSIDTAIGGPPQLAKMYQYMNSRMLGVFWPNKDSRIVTIGGRPLLGYERTDALVLDPDTMNISFQRSETNPSDPADVLDEIASE